MLITGDYKFDQTPVDGTPADVSRLAELGREGVLLLCGDSTNADRPGFSPSRVGRRAAPGGGVRALRGAHRRDELRLEHPPRAAGRRRGRRARAQGRAGRALDAQERRTSAARSATSRCPTGCSSSRARSTTSPTSKRRDHLDRLPGRAAVGAAAHGLPRPPPGRAARRRHGRLLARRRSPATSARSTRRSTGSTTSAAT